MQLIQLFKQKMNLELQKVHEWGKFIIWGNTYKTYLKRRTTLKNRAVKISVGAH